MTLTGRSIERHGNVPMSAKVGLVFLLWAYLRGEEWDIYLIMHLYDYELGEIDDI